VHVVILLWFYCLLDSFAFRFIFFSVCIGLCLGMCVFNNSLST